MNVGLNHATNDKRCVLPSEAVGTRAYGRGVVEVVCSWCGKPKEVKYSHYRRGNRFFCDNSAVGSCRAMWDSAFKTGPGNPNFKEKVTVYCEVCGKQKEIKPSRYAKSETKRFYCNVKCQSVWMAKNQAGSNSVFWKHGVKANNIPLYETYKDKVGYAACVRKAEDGFSLEIKCSYCGKFHTPSVINLKNIMQKKSMEFYCSDGGKQACPVFRQRVYPKGFKPATSREVVPELRQIVFERDRWKCQRCESSDQIHCHHIQGYAQNKIMANDPDNCITLCKKCHKEVHKTEGCKYSDLKCNQALSDMGFKEGEKRNEINS